MEFQNVCKDFPIFLTYAMATLDVVKKKIVTNNVGDLSTYWEKMHDMLVIQLTAIQTSFGKSCTVLEHRFKDVTLYSGLRVMCLDMFWATLFWKRNVVGEHCVWTRKFVVVFKGHRMGYHVHALFLQKYVTTNLFCWMKYTIIGIGYIWVKKIMKMVFLSRRSGMVFKNVSRNSLIK